MTIFEAVRIFLETAIIPSSFLNYEWWGLFFDIFTIVITSLIFLFAFLLPFYRLLKYGLFGESKKNKSIKY